MFKIDKVSIFSPQRGVDTHICLYNVEGSAFLLENGIDRRNAVYGGDLMVCFVKRSVSWS